jgi:serine/threonine-protein kinase
MQDRSGEVLDGRYALVRLIGEGGMGQVYEGRHLVTGRRVAVKFLLDTLSGNAEAVGRFYREARAATAIGSDNICQVLDMRPPEQGQPYLVLEYLDGEPLADRLAREACLTIPDALDIMVQVLEALQAAHNAGIVHRDIKPENIFLITRRGRRPAVKLLDFGISKFTESGRENLSLTRTGSVLGTPYYMSPEQARGDRSIGPLSDIYSTGVILYEALTGAVPFDAEAFSALVVKIVSASPEHPSDRRADLPRGLGDIVLKGFAREEGGRFQSAAEFAQALRQVALAHEILVPFDEPTPTSQVARIAVPSQPGVSRQTGTPMVWEQQEPPKSRRGLIGALIGAAVVVVVVGLVTGLVVLPSIARREAPRVAVVGPGPGPAKLPTTPAPVDVPVPVDNPLAKVSADAGVVRDGAAARDGGAVTPASTPGQMRLRLSAEPSTAQVFLDGRPLDGNPVELDLPADGASHTFRATAHGYRDGERVFTATGDANLQIALKRRAVEPPPVRPPPPVKTKRPPPRDPGEGPIADPWAR